MDRGALVPDDVTIAMIQERLSRPDCSNGALLDGFPRTPTQAKALDEILSENKQKIDCVPYINVPAEVLIERLGGRWTCPKCGFVYHEKFNPPTNPGICDKDQSELYQRSDDKADTVKKRIDVYWEQTSPLIEYYRLNGTLAEIDGTQPIEIVTSRMLETIQRRNS
jgi:adenylate kinase